MPKNTLRGAGVQFLWSNTMFKFKFLFYDPLDCRSYKNVCKWIYDKLSAIGHTSVPRPSQKSGHLLVHPINLGKVAYESSLSELSRHVWHLCQNLREVLQKLEKPQKNAQKWANLLDANFHYSSSEWCDDHFSFLTCLY